MATTFRERMFKAQLESPRGGEKGDDEINFLLRDSHVARVGISRLDRVERVQVEGQGNGRS